MKHKNSVHLNSRARSTATVKDRDLQKLRVQTWYRHLLERAVEGELDRHDHRAAMNVYFGIQADLPNLNAVMQKWLDAQVEHNSARLTLEETEVVQRLTRSRYDEGKSTPTGLTINAFEQLLPGSAAVYDLGPGGLPFWSVLDGDMAVSRSFVQEMLNPSPEQWQQGFSVLVQDVLDSLIAPAHRVNLDAISVLRGAQPDAHPVWLSYINSRHAATFSDDTDELPETFMQNESILMAIALANLATEIDASPQLQLEWLLVGLCWGVIGHQIDERIQEYVLTSVKRRGKVMDAALKKVGSGLPKFEERWPGGLAP